MSSDTLLVVLDLGGIVVFAIAGALTGVEKRLDLFGAIFLASATAIGDGIGRLPYRRNPRSTIKNRSHKSWERFSF